jgi:hypothetical protein
MADDTNPRYYGSNDPYPRDQDASASASGQNDPLAELARLIGQTDPFSEFNRDRGRAPKRDPYQSSYDSAADWGASASSPDDYAPRRAIEPFQEPEQPQYTEPAPYDPGPNSSSQPPSGEYGYDPPRYDAPRYEDQSSAYQTGEDLYPASYDRTPSHANHDREVHPAYDGEQAPPVFERAGQAPYRAKTSHEERVVPSALDRSLHSAYERPSQPAHDDRQPPRSAARSRSPYASPAYDRPHDALDRSPSRQPDDNASQAHGDDIYDEMPSGRRRGSLVTVFAVLCLAVLGTAGAFAYRAVFGSSPTSAAPPVIRAETGPSKIVPPPVTVAEAPSGKLSYERVGAPGQPEKVVPREEQPLDMPATRSVPPRVAGASPGSGPGASAPGGTPTVTASTPPTAAPAGPAEPRKIRTVTIRPDPPAAAETPARPSRGGSVPDRQRSSDDAA